MTPYLAQILIVHIKNMNLVKFRENYFVSQVLSENFALCPGTRTALYYGSEIWGFTYSSEVIEKNTLTVL